MFTPNDVYQGRELIPGGLFLACHVRGDKAACDKVRPGPFRPLARFQRSANSDLARTLHPSISATPSRSQVYGPTGKGICDLPTTIPYPKAYSLKECEVQNNDDA